MEAEKVQKLKWTYRKNIEQCKRRIEVRSKHHLSTASDVANLDYWERALNELEKQEGVS